MTFKHNFHDPLSINLRRQTRMLLSAIPSTSQHYQYITDALNPSQLLAAISACLAEPSFTAIIAKLFRPLLMDLCARWIDDSRNSENHLVALSYIVEVHEELFPILNQLLLTHFEGGPLVPLLSPVLSLEEVNPIRLHRVLLAYYRILQINREFPRHSLWSLAPLHKLIFSQDVDNGSRFLAIRCYSLQSGMGEVDRLNLERNILGEPCRDECKLNYGQNLNGTENNIDGWVMPAVELDRVREERAEIANAEIDFYSSDETDEVWQIQRSDINPWIVNVHGVLLLRSSPLSFELNSPLISTPSSTRVLQQLAIHISLCLPTVLVSAPSAGKSLILSHLAKILHPEKSSQIVTIQLADTSLDPRSLLGSYISSTAHPGTFEWKEGVLIQSMREGKWVVFEDVDRGSAEVLGIIKPLTESLELGKWIGGHAKLDVPGHGNVVAHESFRVFATRSSHTSRDGTFSPPTFFGSQWFSEVVVPTPSPEELSSIVDAKFPHLAGDISSAIIRLWDAIRHLGSTSPGLEVGLRELLKFCNRINNLLSSHDLSDVSMQDGKDMTLSDVFSHPTSRELIYVEARDVFFGVAASTPTIQIHLATVAELVGEHLGIDPERQQWILSGKTPQFSVNKDANGQAVGVTFGRIHLRARSNKAAMIGHSRPFAMHKPAINLLSRIATAVSHLEPVLLTGETGTGKTSVISHLASILNQPLISLNLSHQTESSDLIGGLKPIDARIPATTLQEKFNTLFATTFSRKKNEKFETEIRKAVNDCKWKRAVGLWKECVRLAVERIQTKQAQENPSTPLEDDPPRKRRKTVAPSQTSLSMWTEFLREVEVFEVQHVHGNGKFAFGFVEGPLVKALRSGYWILLDEINLASSDTLESVSSLLQDPTASITLTEHGSLEPIPRHPDFRLFACMNPATDVGKKDLPPAIRSRFTEIDVPSPDSDKDTLVTLITQYIGHAAVSDKKIIMDITDFYVDVKRIAEGRQIADGANHRPHFSLRTLTRALTFASDIAVNFGLRRSVWEGCLMAFTMTLDAESEVLVMNLAKKYLLSGVSNPHSMLSKEPSAPTHGQFIKFGPFYLEQGPQQVDSADDYIITPSVAQKLIDLARVILTRRFPVLIEGPTSSGKTSAIEYLSRRTGHRFIRINNHEHTDIQEYLGSYVSDPLTGKLVYKDGLLVQALRSGHWLVLDELNLAPTDVLEALNRLLDDNRELVIPETQEIIRPHPHFMLFATQNPPGVYAGRKILSRAFRNRFLEVHFKDVPQEELETILCQRCRIAPSYAKRIVNIFRELQKQRQTGRVFESKHGFATLRDLFRWANRDAVGYQELANNGYMLLAERTRRLDDKRVVKEVIEKEMGVKIDEDAMYSLQSPDFDMEAFLGNPIPKSAGFVWTNTMKRLYTLVCRSLRFREPVLLVGETGTGKTSICQVFSEASSRRLVSLNCHQNTETADIIGGLRPVRNRNALQADAMSHSVSLLREMGLENLPSTVEGLAISLSSVLMKAENLDAELRSRVEGAHRLLVHAKAIFQWHDGPLVDAMRNGDVFLMDEISLADDSILERLNSVLEPGRSIVLAERGGADPDDLSLCAEETFSFVATMNPGGDYGKKELSPALRNRFTEIWVPPIDDRRDLELIVKSSWKYPILQLYTSVLLDFVDWLCEHVGDRSLLSLRDILGWVGFLNSAYEVHKRDQLVNDLFHHGAHMTYLDGLSSFPQLTGYSKDALQSLKNGALNKLQALVPLSQPFGTTLPDQGARDLVRFGSFTLPRGSFQTSYQAFNFTAPTTLNNAMRVVRACQVAKPILLEGSPGVGKTSLISALANLSGHKLCRINLSDQTDLIDLFGSDLPLDGGEAGVFEWKDAEFLRALQDGDWVLLDEMNLAPQAVLEGLNAILDHRGAVYIPELNRSFKCHPSFRIFAAQNPIHQGGGRKGLPKSFLNRFTKVYLDELTPDDFLTVSSSLFPDLTQITLRSMISFNIDLNDNVSSKLGFAQDGSPWEFNLRDVIRWSTLVSSSIPSRQPRDFLAAVYLHRFRTCSDRQFAQALFDKAFSTPSSIELHDHPPWSITAANVQFGCCIIDRRNQISFSRPHRILKSQLDPLESLGICVSQGWLAIITGPRKSGKTSLVRTLADLTGNSLEVVTINPGTDTMDILGSFEQVNSVRILASILDEVICLLELDVRALKEVSTDLHLANTLRRACNKISTSRPTNLIQATFQLVSRLVASDSCLKDHCQAMEADIKRMMEYPAESGRFEWVDGPLVKAMKSGQWLVLDGANLCNPSVLDRLNSLCEHEGHLSLSERGFVNGEVEIMKPHPRFRLFMTVDPRHGELSRAMRNRGVEIYLQGQPVGNDFEIVGDFNRLPTFSPGHSYEVQATAYDAIRRGLLVQHIPISSITSTGHSLDHDSALAYLIDTSPVRLSTQVVVSHQPWVFFLNRTLVPAYTPYLRRYVNASTPEDKSIHQLLRDYFANFPHEELNQTLLQYRQSYSLWKHLPFDAVLYQPMEFYWNDGSLQNRGLLPDNPGFLSHLLVSEILNLAAVIYLHQQEDRLNAVVERNTLEKDGQTNLSVKKLLEELANVGLHILHALRTSTSMLNSAKLASTLLSAGHHLRKAVNSPIIDFSALYAISNWLYPTLRNPDPVFLTVVERLKALHRIALPSAGLGLIKLWSCLFLEELPPATVDTAAWTDRMVSSLCSLSDSALLRRQAFDVISLETFPSLVPRSRDLSELRATLNKHLNVNFKDTFIEHANYVDPQSSILELSLLYMSSQPLDSKILKSVMQEVVNLASYKKKTSLLRILPLQHLLWVVDAGANDPRYFTRALISWIEGIWKTTLDSNISGPSILCHPVLLHRAIETCNVGQVQLRNLPNYDKLVLDQVQISLISASDSAGRVTQLARVFFGSLSSIASSYASSYDPATFAAIQRLASQGMEDFQAVFCQGFALLKQSTDKVFSDAIDAELNHVQSSSNVPMQLLALAWIGVGRLILYLSIPDSPVDPAVVQNTTYDLLRRNEDHLKTQIHLHGQLERLVTGNVKNEIMESLTSRLSEVQSQLDGCSGLPSRRASSRLHLFWSEISQFTKSVLDPTKFSALLDALFVGHMDATRRETVLQESLDGFYRRLDTIYPEFSDISIILKLAILHIRLGVRMLADFASFATSNGFASKMADFLLPFPSVRCTSQVIHHFEDLKSSSSAVFLPILLAVSASSAEIALGSRSANPLSLVDVAYEQAVGLWLIDRAKETDWQKEKDSLYRSSTSGHHALSDAQIEEGEFLAMFPVFEDAFEAAAKSGDPKFDAKRPLSRIQPSDAISLLHIHFTLTESQIDSRCVVDPFDKFRELRNIIVRNLLQQSPASLPATLDHTGAYLQLNLLHETLQDLSLEARSRPASYNFYTDPNYQELRRASLVVMALRQRLEVLSEEWPDQMVLQRLLEKCDYILGVTAASPVARVLSMVEQLLEQTDDWEIYAHRNNSIKSDREELIRVVVEWRRLELSCWQNLLDSQSTTFANEVSGWWFRLYDVIVRGSLSASQETTTDSQDSVLAYIESLIPLLDDFMRNGPLGQFHARLRLLRSFERYTSMVIPVKPFAAQEVLGRIKRILHYTCSYFDLFSESLQKLLDDQKGLLETEVKGLVKLASWKDVNIQALRQSARKTHHQLFKIVKKYRDVLRQPVRNRLVPFTSGDTESRMLSTGSISNDPPQDENSTASNLRLSLSQGVIADLQGRFNKFCFLIHDSIKPFVKKFPANLLDEFAVEIITTSKRLAELVIPSALTGELRERHIKALQVRKRKAWSDLLQELKQAGLKSNLKPEILRQNTSQTYVQEQIIMPQVTELHIVIDKSEIYFLKLSGALPALRAALSSHHSDLTTRDMQRGVAFLECGFSMALDLRSRFAVALNIMNQLQRALRRLKMLANEATIISMLDPQTQLVPTADLLCKVNHALRELHSDIIVANGLGLSQPIPNCLLDEVLNAASFTKDLHDGLIRLLDDLNAINFPCFAKYEYDLVTKAQNLIPHIIGLVSNWSRQYPVLHFLLAPLLRWLEEHTIFPLLVREDSEDSNTSKLEQLINCLLVSIQTLASRASDECNEDSTGYLLKGYTLSRDLTHLLYLTKIHDQLKDVCAELSSRTNIKENLMIITSFFDPYLSLAREQLSSTGNWMKTLLKFDFVLCSLLQSLCQQGFCRPSDTEPGSQPNGDAMDETGGVGIGDGTGVEDVGKEIEDESQIEGLQGEGEHDDQGGANEEKDAIEMSDDFGGDLRDVSEGEDEDVDKLNGEEEQEFDETLGDLDPLDPSTLDEKMWDDGKPPDDSSVQENRSDATQSKDQKESSEVMGKEGKEKEGKKEPAREQQQETETEGPRQEERDIEPEEDIPSDPVVNGAPMDQIPAANPLDLPDDIELGGDDMNAKQQELGDSDHEDSDQPTDQLAEESAMDIFTPDELPSNNNESGDTDGHDAEFEVKDTQGQLQDSKEDEDNIEEGQEGNTAARPDLTSGSGAADPTDFIKPDPGVAGPSGNTISVSSGNNQDSELTNNDEKANDLTKPSEDPFPQGDNSGTGTSGNGQGESSSRGEKRQIPNPLRSLGDALKLIQQRFDEILEPDPEDARHRSGDVGGTSQIEYLRPDDADHEMQAFGPAEEHVARLEQLNVVDDTMDVDYEEALGIEEPEPEPGEHIIRQLDQESDFIEQPKGFEGAHIRSFQGNGQDSEMGRGRAAEDAPMEDMSHDVEKELRIWRNHDCPGEDAQHIWRQYETLTQDLAHTLCEQLRLILEPTLATRLRGDYRTGKRLNMKKIIPYIASDYTKDKIWLRRTKPSQREYQVLISIDDSRSMAESRCIHLAYQTLALIANALSKLESGDIAIAKFGETVDILHQLDEGPFTVQSGTKVINSFRFAQKATNVLSLMETSLKFLESARERRGTTSSSAADLWQLQIIISDGICQDHEKLQAVLRKAEEQRVLVVFIILDSLKSGTQEARSFSDASKKGEHSILEMKKVDFKMVDGRMELQQKKYLDSFPFEYYVVLRNVETLPEVLAETLKQFFERISEQ